MVVAIIALVTGTAGWALSGGGGSGHASLALAQGTVSAVFQSARMQAMLKGTMARVIIASETSPDVSRRLRFIGIVYGDLQKSGCWIAADDGVLLPEGVFFVPPQADGPASLPRSTCPVLPGTPLHMSVSYPDRHSVPGADSGQDWYVYQFGPDGLSQNPNARVVLAMGSIKGDGAITFLLENSGTGNSVPLYTGFYLRRSGTLTLFNDEDAVQ